MKKLDKLIVTSFIGPFFLTFFVVIFILLLQFLLRYFQDLVGKGLGLTIYAKLLGYFSINMTPSSFPLAVLLSCLITYGNLGEHSELNAIKTSGIPMTRTLVPIFIISIFLMVVAFISNNYIVPKANLKAYSLLWDIKNKTPALNLKEGVFYGDIPGYQIKVARKYPDGKSLKDVIIYNHSKSSGNTEVT
ncbi:MAG TPA: LptF/LptG family permease, partial [Cyclobacteriaceae bacterium]|nr:LptF/LptG family permease [Cyclobacteriaceae bacterium]